MRILAVLAVAAGLVPAGRAAAEPRVLPLAGTWGFRLDPANSGHREAWQDREPGADTIFLPGSTDQAGYGTKTSGPEKGWLSRPFTYTGAAWYQKRITIPEAWRGRRVTLFLERPHWQTEAWVDGRALGMQNSLVAPHVYDLGTLAPGVHRVTLCVDNVYRIGVGLNAHSVTEHTQTNWNGIVGRIELQAVDAAGWIEDVRVTAAGGRLRVEVAVGGAAGGASGGASGGTPGEVTAAVGARRATARAVNGRAEMTLPIGGLRRWDEYEGVLHEVRVTLTAPGAHDERIVSFGVREIAAKGTQFTLNGRPVFLRGTLECNIFPKTGYPPMTGEEWERLFRIARSYGLNHFRFHSWCPPEAAFAAADRAGFLLHVELPVWSYQVGKDAALNEFMPAEAKRMLATYGNHPSFTMLCLGNELVGDYAWMDRLVAGLQAADPRRLYTFAADHRRREPGPASDYYVAQNTKTGPVRIHGAQYGKTMAGTDYDFSRHVAENGVPLVAHELGQWVTFPGFDEIAKYTGVLKPRNLEAFREQLAARGMVDQPLDFQAASGRFAWRLYKEEMEAAFRTPGFGGFQLLQLQDFPGQGEALIGLLDSFWDSKGIMRPAEFRRFCNETVALLRFGKFAWRNDETFTAKALVAHYGKQAIPAAIAEWEVRDDAGKVWAQGKFTGRAVPLGSVTPLGEIAMPLGGVVQAKRLKVSLALVDTDVRNEWDIWVYPVAPPTAVPAAASADVLVTTAFDDAARRRLAEGGRVLLLATPQEMPIRFLPVFWSLSWVKEQPGVMGVLCDPSHPALAGFPTDRQADFQWWDVLEGSHAFVLDNTPAAFRPLVQVIDDYHRNHKLGAVFEARVGKGRLLAVALDLSTGLDKRLAARQLRYSLERYAASESFAPVQELPVDLVERLAAGR
jgi:hypothetical protein